MWSVVSYMLTILLFLYVLCLSGYVPIGMHCVCMCVYVQNRGDHQECSQSHSTLYLRQWVSLNLKLTCLDRLVANRALWFYLLLPSPKLDYRYMISDPVLHTSGHPNSSHVWSANILVTEASSTQSIFKTISSDLTFL